MTSVYESKTANDSKLATPPTGMGEAKSVYMISKAADGTGMMWEAEVRDNLLILSYGRIGAHTQTDKIDCGTKESAIKTFDKKCKEKLSKGYTVAPKGSKLPTEKTTDKATDSSMLGARRGRARSP